MQSSATELRPRQQDLAVRLVPEVLPGLRGPARLPCLAVLVDRSSRFVRPNLADPEVPFDRSVRWGLVDPELQSAQSAQWGLAGPEDPSDQFVPLHLAGLEVQFGQFAR